MNDETKPRWLKEMTRLSLEPNDILIIHTTKRLSPVYADYIKGLFGGLVDNRIILIDDSIQIGAIGVEN